MTVGHALLPSAPLVNGDSMLLAMAWVVSVGLGNFFLPCLVLPAVVVAEQQFHYL